MAANNEAALQHNVALGKRAGLVTGLVGGLLGGPFGCMIAMNWVGLHPAVPVATGVAIAVVLALLTRALGGRLGAAITRGLNPFVAGLGLAAAAVVLVGMMDGTAGALAHLNDGGLGLIFGITFYGCIYGAVPGLILGMVFGGWLQLKKAR